jgi:hypothetical protein
MKKVIGGEMVPRGGFEPPTRGFSREKVVKLFFIYNVLLYHLNNVDRLYIVIGPIKAS